MSFTPFCCCDKQKEMKRKEEKKEKKKQQKFFLSKKNQVKKAPNSTKEILSSCKIETLDTTHHTITSTTKKKADHANLRFKEEEQRNGE